MMWALNALVFTAVMALVGNFYADGAWFLGYVVPLEVYYAVVAVTLFGGDAPVRWRAVWRGGRWAFGWH